MAASKLFAPAELGSFKLANRIVMAPMTRNRAIGNTVSKELEAVYYGERAGAGRAGLIITEGISPNANGCGYARMPGLWSDAQVQGWKSVADAVHQRGGTIFAQIMHCGRIVALENLPADAGAPIAPSAIKADGMMWVDAVGGQVPHAEPVAMTEDDIKKTVADFAEAAENAVKVAGLDGVELHGANGYLIEQFLRPTSNQRTDAYGGSIEGRARFLLEVVDAVTAAIGAERVGVRLSPYGVFNDMPITPGDAAHAEDYTWLAKTLSGRIAYLHVTDHAAMGAPPVGDAIKSAMRAAFNGTFILCGGFDATTAAAAIDSGAADLVAVGRPFVANPDLTTRWEKKAEVTVPDYSKLYTPGPEGYLGYVTLA